VQQRPQLDGPGAVPKAQPQKKDKAQRQYHSPLIVQPYSGQEQHKRDDPDIHAIFVHAPGHPVHETGLLYRQPGNGS
jgi:hypothetical protein